jgi:hypothetical protein
MGLFKGYSTVPPKDFPSNWALNLDHASLEYFKTFCDEKIKLPEIDRIKKFMKNNSVQEFLKPIMKNEYYKIVSSMTQEEVNKMPSLSSKKYEKKAFGLIKNKDVEIIIGEKKIVPHKLKTFMPMKIPDIIQRIIPSENVNAKEKIQKICNNCDRGKINRGQFEWRSTYVPYRPGRYERDFNGNMRRIPSREAHYVDTKHSLERKCPVCKGKWKYGFTFNDFSKYSQKFNKEIDKINKEIQEIQEKGSHLVTEYNEIIEILNSKIIVWNNKCPYNAIDENYESDKHYFMYWSKQITRNLKHTTVSNSPTHGAMPKGFEKNIEPIKKPNNTLPEDNSRQSESVNMNQENANLKEELKAESTIQEKISSDLIPEKLEDDPLEVLKIRFAKGEITTDEFEEMKGVLGR